MRLSTIRVTAGTLAAGYVTRSKANWLVAGKLARWSSDRRSIAMEPESQPLPGARVWWTPVSAGHVMNGRSINRAPVTSGE